MLLFDVTAEHVERIAFASTWSHRLGAVVRHLTFLSPFSRETFKSLERLSNTLSRV